MSEWNVIHENFHTKHSVLTAPDEHMPYTIQLHIMNIRWMKQQNIWSVHMTSIGKENRSSQSLQQKRVGRQSEGLGGVVWVYKIGLKWPVIAMAITWKPQSLSLCLRDRELEHRDREGGRERGRERWRAREGEREREREGEREICTDLFPWLLIPFFFISSIFAWWLLTFVFCLLQHIVNSKLVWW